MSWAVLPRPVFGELLAGTISWRSPLRVHVDQDEWRPVIQTFAADLASSVGWEIELVDTSAECDLDIRRLLELRDEQYQLVLASPSSIEAGTPDGLYRALTTLRQLGPAQWWSRTTVELDTARLPCVVIQDAPRFAWRGVHLDVARHFFGVDVVCRLIDLLSAHRMNRLHLHLNDDQGWRVQIPTWPRLTEVGSHRRSSPIGHERDGIDDHVPHAGFYTGEDLRVIRDHAAMRFVQIVPEIDLPGHAQAVLAAYPALGNTDEEHEVWTRWGISEHVLNVSSDALDFAADVVAYV
ncbi:MAG TPA: family 20 glycosylhydrolase, partial [Acidimicrobiales bacterium]|nr:family 20 glycosylhydrolase [Acidimicrobiales bacterium]